MKRVPTRRWAGRLAAITLAGLLAACGGGGGSAGFQPASCGLFDQKAALGAYMGDRYFWYDMSPRPDPAPYTDPRDYFDALLYTGTDARFPADRWSNSETDASFDRFFTDGASLGWGVSVAGLEVAGNGALPLYVRYVEPRSPAAAAGVLRGDRVMAINGRSAADLVAADDFSALNATQPGQTLTLVLRRAGVADRTVVLRSAEFALSPVTGAALMRTAGGRLVGYVNVKDMIDQAATPMEAAFALFKSNRVDDLVLDLRYNGGGFVSTGATLASYIAGLRGSGRSYAKLLYNDQNTGLNSSFGFASLGNSLGVPRVFVLTGRRTCSSSEQVINGLRGAGVQVVSIGETTCGKPVGFNARSQCGITYSAVNFESVNHLNEGRYFDGFDATCPVAEDFTVTQGSWDDPLMDTAGRYADIGPSACAVAAGRAQPLALRAARRLGPEPGERQGMLAR